MARTFTDAAGAMKAWINGRTATLVGLGNPLQMGAYLHHPRGGAPAAYALLEEGVSVRSLDSPENPDMMAALTAQVYGETRKIATDAAVALAEELSSTFEGQEAQAADSVLLVVDDVSGPLWAPDGDRPRLLVNWTVRTRPA